MQFCDGGECRHAGILTYFRDTQRIRACGHCDVCLPESPRRVPAPAPSASYGGIGFPKPGKRKSARDAAQTPLGPREEVRQEVLREWRKAYAESLDVPAFLVFSNQTLRHLAVAAPKTLSDLAGIHGLGEKKIAAFGERLLAELARAG